jgi:hypothetical protein
MNTPTFLKHSHSTPIRLWRWDRQSVPKRRHIKFRCPGNYPEESRLHTEHGESLKSRISDLLQNYRFVGINTCCQFICYQSVRGLFPACTIMTDRARSRTHCHSRAGFERGHFKYQNVHTHYQPWGLGHVLLRISTWIQFHKPHVTTNTNTVQNIQFINLKITSI